MGKSDLYKVPRKQRDSFVAQKNVTFSKIVYRATGHDKNIA